MKPPDQLSAAQAGPPHPAPSSVDTALAALEHYGAGASRGALIPLDEAAAASAGNPAGAARLEQRLASLLSAQLAAPAAVYICAKLRLVGTARSVPALARLMSQPELAHAACEALQAIPDPAAAAALRAGMARLEDALKVGPIDALGARRDQRSVSQCAALLSEGNRAVARAAAAALARIGSARAARALRSFVERRGGTIEPEVADACLVCAENLVAEGRRPEARALLTPLVAGSLPEHVRLAAARALAGAG
jgi:hypothetical protein